MDTYYCIDYRTHTDNTAEYGFGDYHDKIYYLMCTARADTKRKAQNRMKKDRPNLIFGGRFSPQLYTMKELETDHLSHFKNLVTEYRNDFKKLTGEELD